jgi:hypothetical protein
MDLAPLVALAIFVVAAAVIQRSGRARRRWLAIVDIAFWLVVVAGWLYLAYVPLVNVRWGLDFNFWPIACVLAYGLVRMLRQPVGQGQTPTSPAAGDASGQPQIAGAERRKSRITPAQRCAYFLAGTMYLAMCAGAVSGVAKCSFLAVFPVTFCVFCFSGSLALFWLTLGAKQRNARPGQFGIGSLLLLMVFVAIFFGAVSWLTAQALPEYRIAAFCFTSVILLVAIGLFIPIGLGMLESLLWGAVWLVKRPVVRRMLRGVKRPGR